MRDKALVTEINGSLVSVVPLITDACINCTHGSCAKRGTPFTVINRRNISVTKGTVVRIGASAGAAAVQGVIAVLLPVGCAIGGYFAAVPAANLFHHAVTEGIRAAMVFLCLAVSAAVVFAFSRRRVPFGIPEILERY